MAFVLKDRVKETSTTTGTGTITLAGASIGYQGFSTVGNANTTSYSIVMGTEWENGIGTYTSSGSTLSRDTVLSSSNSGNKVNFSAGTKEVFINYPAGRASLYDTPSQSTGAFHIPVGTTGERPTGASGMIRYNTTESQYEVYNGTRWNPLTQGEYPYSVEYLVVAGGGAGGLYGGGGAGGFRTGTAFAVTVGTSYTVTVGAGGAGVATTESQTNNPGSNSVFSTITAAGGGGAGNNQGTGGNGGSGGGSGWNTAGGGSGNTPSVSPSQGNNGGNGASGGPNYGGGGGGGAGASGTNGTTTTGGNGGNGTASSISGSSVTYAGGGAGGTYQGGTIGTAGTGGGGAAGAAGGNNPGTNGTSNTGGGGGASSYQSAAALSGSGGSGVVIIRYLGSQRGTGGTVTSSGGYTIHTFTTSGTYTG